MIRASLIGFMILWGAAGWNITASAQWNYYIEEVAGINTPSDEQICGIQEGRVAFISDRDEAASRTWSDAKPAMLYFGEKEQTYSSVGRVERVHSFKSSKSEWGFSMAGDTIYFASSEDYQPGTRGGDSKLFRMNRTSSGWSAPEVLPFCNDSYSYRYPFYVEELGLLLFSSNRRGGQGGYDIWYTYRAGDGWTIPANCGGQVNTSGEEWFPTYYNGDIYFSSDGWVPERGFELFRCEGKDQWMSAVQLEYPINSEADDFSIVFVEEGRGLMTSNRKGGMGGSDIYLFNKVVQKVDRHGFSVRLEANGIALPSAKLDFYNGAGELELTTVTSLQGTASLESLATGKKLKVKLTGIAPPLLGSCILHLLDENGNIVRTFRFNERGELELELLRFVYSDLPLADNVDESMLKIEWTGRIIHNHSPQLNIKMSVVVLDDKGEILAVAKVRVDGVFEVNELKPDYHYQLKISSPVPVDRIVLFDNGRSIVLPVLKQEAYYRRLNPDEAVELVDNAGKKVAVSPSDIFVVNRIYFDLNSAKVTEESAAQLNELSALLHANPGIGIRMSAYADSRGSEDYNLSLSRRRAESLRKYLLARGISETRISCSFFGESGILNECTDTEPCEEMQHAINRRTEITFVRAS